MAVHPLQCVFGNIVIPQRYLMVVMMQLALLNAYNLRVVYNVAITEMMEEKNDTVANACPEYTYEKVASTVKLDWKNELESLTLYAFYIGYIFSHIPGGWLADKIGARPVMGYCMLAATILNLVFPVSIKNIGDGQIAAVVLRMLLGFTQGPLYPAISTFIQCWIPAKERGFLGGVAFGGANIGTVVGSILTGFIIEQTQDWSWPFYVWGILALLWYVLYLLFVYSRPKSHPNITEKELHYLENAVEKRKGFKVPWLKILSSLPCWALLAGQFGHNFIFLTVFTYLPKYQKDILKLNVQANAIFTALPFLMLWISNILFAYFSDFIINREILTIAVARKVYTTYACIVPSSILVIVVYVGCNRTAAIVLSNLSFFMIGPFYSGMKINVNDLTMHYGGTIMAIVNGVGASAGIVGPLLVGKITEDKSIDSWRLVFWIILGVSIGTSIFYIIFAAGERQEWDHQDDEVEDNQ